jgi:putative transport protein
MLGAISGSMTSTPGLAAADSMTETNAHSIAYATVYPVAMVLLIVIVQLISLFL